jgi:DNA-binding transcriptional LysR family regulator
MGVELRHLASLSAVSRELSFRGAAEHLGYVPSAVSQQISRLEEAVGARLVERSPGGSAVRLTAAGDVLAIHGERILHRLHAAEADVSSLDPERGRELHIGVHPRVPAGLVEAAVREFTESCAGVRLVPREARTAGPLLDLVRYGDVDLVFAHLPLPPGPYDHCRLYDEDFVLAAAPGVELAPPGTLADLAQLRLVWLTTNPPWVEPEHLEALADAAVARVDTPRAALALVRAGVGPSILPRSMTGPGIATVPLAPLIPGRTLALVWHAQRRLLAGMPGFVGTVQRLCATR